MPARRALAIIRSQPVQDGGHRSEPASALAPHFFGF
jgi:hypothetical protein